ncbi:MAG: hypothetical protein MK105_13655 [Crocinitomicaceae bacterium]|nr:hypothetical protein [Crocinitomicaceae bacterium]
MITIIAMLSCQSSIEKHDLLLDFKVESRSPENLRQIRSFEEKGFLDKPVKLSTKQIADTLRINFEIFEGASTEIEGNIEIRKDSLILKIGKGIGIRELMIHEYQYEIFNPMKEEYKIRIENYVEIDEL